MTDEEWIYEQCKNCIFLTIPDRYKRAGIIRYTCGRKRSIPANRVEDNGFKPECQPLYCGGPYKEEGRIRVIIK